MLSQDAARARTQPRPQHSVRLVAQATLAGHAWHREDVALPGAYYDLALTHGLQVTYRLAAFDEATARIDAVVVRDGLTLMEPDLVVRQGEAASVHLDSPPLTVEFRIDANAPDE